jgi:hypothetical protein
MAAHALDWGDSLNPRCRGGKWLTLVVMFVGCLVLGDNPNIILFLPYKTNRAGVFVSARTKIVIKLFLRVYGPMRSTHKHSQGFVMTVFGGRTPSYPHSAKSNKPSIPSIARDVARRIIMPEGAVDGQGWR